MAEQLQAADQKQRELESLRRDLIAWVSHDLQTPLTSMRAILEALSDGVVDDPETVKRYLHTAQRDVRSLSSLIDDLFQMAQLDAGGFPLHAAPASLSDLVSDTLESFTELAKQGEITLEGNVDPDVDPVHMDTQAIGRVLNNLIGNALRHTPPQGRVSVWVRRTGKGVEVTVSDTGEGIRAEDLPHIFERFYRGEKSRNRAHAAAQGWGWRSRAASCRRTGARSGWKAEPAKARSSPSTFPNRTISASRKLFVRKFP